MATAEIIDKALETMKNHDWYWMMAEYSHPAMDYARGNMRLFVELVASIKNPAVEKALRELWIATHDYIHANIWGKDEKASKLYEVKKAELMAVIRPDNLQLAA